MPSPHEDMTALLGPAALGLLTDTEQRQLDRHLAGCARCRTEADDLTGVAERLADLDGADALVEDLAPDGARVDAVLARIAADRRRARRSAQRWQAAVASAACLAVLAAGLVTATALSNRQPAVPMEGVPVQALPAAGDVSARADLVAHTWGVEIKLTATGLAPGQPYTVQVRTTGGAVVDAGAFLGTGDRTLLCNLNASVLRPDAASFAVLDRRGTPVLSAQL